MLVDLRRCIFVDAYVLVMLLTMITVAIEEAGYTVTLRLPTRRSALTYFARMHFFDLLPPEVAIDGPLPTVAERGAYLMPLTRLNVQGENRRWTILPTSSGPNCHGNSRSDSLVL